MGPDSGTIAEYRQGTVLLVPFPFTNLEGHKRRPALVVSPEPLEHSDLILCAITSQVPAMLTQWDIRLGPADLLGRQLPKPSIIKVSKLFTLHQGLIVGTIGQLRESKLDEVLFHLRSLFRRPRRA